MRRNEINHLVSKAMMCFAMNGWALPPCPRWDVTDFGLGDWRSYGLVLVNLCEEPEYCEKLMYAQAGMRTPAHCHIKKKEDIICRNGALAVQLWSQDPASSPSGSLSCQVDGEMVEFEEGEVVILGSGQRVTLPPGLWHEFWPKSEECIIGEVSTANDDLNDNKFSNPLVGRFSVIEEDEEPLVRLVSDG